MAHDDRRAAEALLRIQLPAGISDLEFFRWQPSPDLRFFQAYLKFASTRQDFDLLAERLRRHGTAGSAAILPASWEGPDDAVLHWWDPGPETPVDAAACPYGVNGWIVAKHERGSTYIIVTDSGEMEGTPGPW